jgi:hypothetical protein
MTEIGDQERKNKLNNICLTIRIGRHGEKGTDGELLSSDFLPAEFGQKIGKNLKVYTSFSNRAFQTGARIAEAAETPYASREKFNLVSSKLIPDKFNALLREDYSNGFEAILADDEARAVAASGIAAFIDRFRRMGPKLNDGTVLNFVGVTHDLEIACFLRETLIRIDDQGQIIRGFKNISEIGGPFDTNENFALVIRRENGRQTIAFRFENQERLPGVKCELDMDRVAELAELFREKTKIVS